MNDKRIPFLFNLLLTLFHIYGLYPDTKNEKYYWIFSYIFHFFFSLLFSIGGLIYAITFLINDTEKSTDALSSTLCVVAFVLRVFNYYYYRREIIDFIGNLREIHEYESPEEIELARKNIRFLSILSYFFWACGHLAIFSGCFKAFRKENKEMPIVCWFPWEWENEPVPFWTSYTYAVYCSVTIMQLNIGLDIFSSVLMDTIATRFDILAMRLEKLGTNVKSYSIELKKLIVCVEHHQYLLRLVDTMENFLSTQFFIQILFSGIIFSSSVYQLTSMNMPEQYLQFAYAVLVMGCVAFEAFSYTYYGSRILNATDSLTNAIYFSPWYETPLFFRKYLILFLERSKRNSIITAGKLFDMNLALFTTIVSFSHRLYALRSSVAHRSK